MSLETVMSLLNKKYGKGTVVRASDAIGLRIRRFSTGSFALDVALGGGWAEGRINEIAGHFSSYKSTLATVSCNSYLAKDPARYVVWFDIENSFDTRWLKFLDADPERFLLVSPLSGEDTVDMAYDVLKQGDQALVIIDSMAALTPIKDQQSEMERNTIGSQPRFIAKMLRKLVPLLRKDLLSDNPKSTVLALNQVRVNIGKLFGDPEEPTGGKSLEHHASICVLLKRKGYLYEELKDQGETVKQTVGSEVRFTILKNKTGGNVQDKGVFSFYNRAYGFRRGGTIDNASDILPLAAVYRIVKRNNNSWLYTHNHTTLSGGSKEKFIKKLYENPKVMKSLYRAVLKEHLDRMTLKSTSDVKKKGKKSASLSF